MGGYGLEQAISWIAVGAIPVLFAITLHEVAHGWAARRYGDNTAEMMGRLSLNPLRHIDPVGTIVVPLTMLLLPVLLGAPGGVLFGWAKPVPVAFGRLRNPKADMVKVAAAGPAANIVMGVGWGLFLKFVFFTGLNNSGAGEFLILMARIGITINALLAAFNIIPIPPLDGGRILRGLVNESIGRYLDRIEPFGLIIIVLLLVSGVLWAVVGPLLFLVERLIVLIVGL